jgi:hypothetical protein
MRGLIILIAIAATIFIGCNSNSPSTSNWTAKGPFRVIADPHVSTNELIRALKEVRSSGTTNEPPQFWSSIANDTNYSIDHRKRAALQLFARHFKPGMTIHEVAGLLSRPNWLSQRGCNFFSMGGLPPGASDDDNWAWACIFFNDPQPAAIWFGFKSAVNGNGRDLYQCLEGNPQNPLIDDAQAEIDNIKVISIISSEELPNFHRMLNTFGIPDSRAIMGGPIHLDQIKKDKP